jgi:hypothetical protein
MMVDQRGGKLQEHDAMTCRACSNEERASEGYPCATCGTFLCLMCVFKGVVRCASCDEQNAESDAVIKKIITQMPRIDWPEH